MSSSSSTSSGNQQRETTPPDCVPAVAVVPMATVVEEETDGGGGGNGGGGGERRRRRARFNGSSSVEEDGGDAGEEGEDELDLFPGGLELPPLRSPRGSLGRSVHRPSAGSRSAPHESPFELARIRERWADEHTPQHSLYGSNCSSRKNSNCSIGSNARFRAALSLSRCSR